MGDVQLGQGGVLVFLPVAKILVDVEFGDTHLLVHLALPHPDQHELVAQLVAKHAKIQAIGRKTAANLRYIHLIAARHA